MFSTLQRKQQLVSDIAELVQIPSRATTEGGEEAKVQSFMARRMRQSGARVRVVEPSDLPDFFSHPLCHRSDRQYSNRPTVIAEMGPPDTPAMLVLAHSDTVPINRPEDWTVPPFGGLVKDDAVWGLGSSDDKWGLAVILTVMAALREDPALLRKRVIFASTVDEEAGVGNGLLLLMLAGVKAEAALYLDGMRMDVGVGNLGGSTIYFHPTRPIAEDVDRRHARLLDQMGREWSMRRAPLFDRPFFDGNYIRNISVMFVDRWNMGEPLRLNFYSLPGEDAVAYRRELEAKISQTLGEEEALYDIVYRHPWFEPSIIPLETPSVRHLSAGIREVLGKEPQISTMPKVDAFVLNNHAKIPTVCFGCTARLEGRGAFHCPDERIEIEKEAWPACQIVHSAVCRWLNED